MATLPASVLDAIRSINITPCTIEDSMANWSALPDILRKIINEVTVGAIEVKRATAQSDWVDPAPNTPYVDCLDDDTSAAVRVYLPRVGERDPNVRSGDQVFYKEYDAGAGVVAWCDSPYLDAKIGTVKFWAGTVANIPAGWAIMDGTANSSSSGINLIDTLIKGDTVSGTANPAVPTGDSPEVIGESGSAPCRITVLPNTDGLRTGIESLTITHNLETDTLVGGVLDILQGEVLQTDPFSALVSIEPETVEAFWIDIDVQSGNEIPVVDFIEILPHTHQGVPASIVHSHSLDPHNHQGSTFPDHDHQVTGLIEGGAHDHLLDPHVHDVIDDGHTHPFTIPPHSHDDPGIPDNITLIPIERIH